MMKFSTKLFLIAVTATGLFAGSAEAYTITYVTSARDGVVPTEWGNLLTNAGYTVQGYTDDNYDVDTPEDIAALEAADLIIFGNSNGSAASGGTTWNQIKTPIINMGPYSMNNWGLTAAGGHGQGTAVTVIDPSDPIWAGVDTSEGTVTLFASNAREIRSAVLGGGEVLARTVGQDDSLMLARWGANWDGSGGGERFFFAGSGTNATDTYHLNAAGETVFLNVVHHTIPEPSTALLAGLGLLGLGFYRRRR